MHIFIYRCIYVRICVYMFSYIYVVLCRYVMSVYEVYTCIIHAYNGYLRGYMHDMSIIRPFWDCKSAIFFVGRETGWR